MKLNAHCFWMMWQHLLAGQFEEAVAMCDRGIDLAELIGSAPVQYGSIKAMALSYMGRFDEVEAASPRRSPTTTIPSARSWRRWRDRSTW